MCCCFCEDCCCWGWGSGTFSIFVLRLYRYVAAVGGVVVRSIMRCNAYYGDIIVAVGDDVVP